MCKYQAKKCAVILTCSYAAAPDEWRSWLPQRLTAHIGLGKCTGLKWWSGDLTEKNSVWNYLQILPKIKNDEE